MPENASDCPSLLDAVAASFKEIDDSDVPPHVAETVQHENAVKAKASTFVGRKVCVLFVKRQKRTKLLFPAHQV